MKVLVNSVSCKKNGGGVFQISCNFLLKTLQHTEIEWYYITSNDIDIAIGENFKELRDKTYFVFPTQVDLQSYGYVSKQIKEIEHSICPDIIYTTAAPSYFFFSIPEVMRFTNPWVTHPNKFSWGILSKTLFIKYKIKNIITKILIKKAHFFITQSETCKKGLIRITGEPASHIKVVPNVLPAIYQTIDTTAIPDNKFINIACVGGAIPHKNFDIIPQVVNELKQLGFTNIRFHTTLDKDSSIAKKIDYELNKLQLSSSWINHGRLSQDKLGDMYKHCQFCFIPTLLEVFSATTVEAMFFKLPAVVTDFDFNYEVFQNSCLYYKPLDARDAASKFAYLISNPSLQINLKKKMEIQLKQYDNYDNHFNAIIDFLSDVIKLSKRNKD